MLWGMSGRKVTSTAEEVRKVIRDAGLRVTAPRVAVMLRVEQTQGPVTHAEIADALAPQGWDRATIYRNLTDLTEAGLLRRTDMGDHVWRFELAPASAKGHDTGLHPHFVCNTCGDVTCLPDDAIEIQVGHGGPRSLQGREVEIQIKGRCDSCA
jgi:Fur family transcriptional regulator, ferric uptake regulator